MFTSVDVCGPEIHTNMDQILAGSGKEVVKFEAINLSAEYYIHISSMYSFDPSNLCLNDLEMWRIRN
jgi:hypothetical protein